MATTIQSDVCFFSTFFIEASTVTRAATAALTLGLTAAAFVTTGGLAAVGVAAALGFFPDLMKAARKALGGLSKTEKTAETIGGVERTVEKIADGLASSKLDTSAVSGANNAANGLKLKAELALMSDGVLDTSGKLTPKAIETAKPIALAGGQISNSAMVTELTSNCSSIVHWGKFRTSPDTKLSNGQKIQVHFYKNKTTGDVNTNIDFKVQVRVEP